MTKKLLTIIAAAAVMFVFGLTVSAEPSVSADSAVVIDAQNGNIIFGKNESKKRSMASTTKIMTALLTLESGGLDKYFVVDPDAIMVEGTSMGLQKGDKVTKRILCYGMLLPSGNDAANAAAVKVAGTVEKFVDMMNKKAEEIGLKNTSFETPSGLDGKNHYSTAFDMAVLAKYALENKDFYDICSSTSAKVKFGNPPAARYLYNHNRLLKEYDGAIGVKTGFTKKSGRCLVSAAERDGIRAIAVTLNAPNDWQDHKKMLDYAFKRIKKTALNVDLSKVKLNIVGAEKNNVKLEAPYTPQVTLTKEQIEKIEIVPVFPAFVYAPVFKGDIVGYIMYYYDGKLIEQLPVIASENIYEHITEVKKSVFENMAEWLNQIFNYLFGFLKD